MSSDELAYTSAAEIAKLIREKKLSAVEVMRATLSRAERGQKILNCFITIAADQAMRDAQAADDAIARGDAVGPLHGVPLHVKDLVNTKGCARRSARSCTSTTCPTPTRCPSLG
jgi:aspartyl-tRNA(Asn)/glutamyl-tRNA(Gln) amidotransferase subunit A